MKCNEPVKTPHPTPLEMHIFNTMPSHYSTGGMNAGHLQEDGGLMQEFLKCTNGGTVSSHKKKKTTS